MTTPETVGLIVIVALVIGWRLSWLATRLDRAHTRVERRWAALDAALVRRAQAALEAGRAAAIDPSSNLLVCDAAAAALVADLGAAEREQAESHLSGLLSVVTLDGLAPYCERVELAHRLYNDAVVTALDLRHRRIVVLFRLAGHAGEPRAFEMLVNGELTWPRGFVG